MAYSLISHVTVPGSFNGATSGSIDTTGASILIFAIARHGFTADPAVSDSKGNTWNPLTEYIGFIGCVRVFYAFNPTVGTGHTFTTTGGNTFNSACIAAFSGANTSSPFDVENGNAIGSSGTTIQTGSLTPSQDNSLVVSALGTAPDGAPSGYTIDSGFTITDTVNAINGQSSGSGLAYLVQTTATAENPTWTLSTAGSGSGLAATVSSFKSAGAVLSDSVTEAASATDTSNGVVLSSLIESGSAADSVSGPTTYSVSVTEDGSVTDTQNGQFVVFVTELASAADNTTSTAEFVSGISSTEAITAADTSAAQANFTVSFIEAGDAADTTANIESFVSFVTEAEAAIDQQDGSVVFGSILDEIQAADDSIDANVVYQFAMIEAIHAIDNTSNTADFRPIILEVAAAVDSDANGLHDGINEIGNASDFFPTPHVLSPVVYYPPIQTAVISKIQIDRGSRNIELPNRTKIDLIKARYAATKRQSA